MMFAAIKYFLFLFLFSLFIHAFFVCFSLSLSLSLFCEAKKDVMYGVMCPDLLLSNS
jgi:hypothetical protein